MVAGKIINEKLNTDELVFHSGGIASKELLTGEIPGVRTSYTVVKKGCGCVVAPEKDNFRVVFFIKGCGHIEADGKSYSLNEMAVLCPPLGMAFSVYASDEDIQFIEILYKLTGEDFAELSKRKENSVYFANYSECKTYREAIKSEKTINRTIVPENIAPRFCMGSVQTVGPDAVGAHSHPMLEQLFYGLPGNCCHVRADEAEIPFGENVLLHIPLGSMHGVRVDEGETLHYLWVDLFRSHDMSYIAEHHFKDE